MVAAQFVTTEVAAGGNPEARNCEGASFDCGFLELIVFRNYDELPSKRLLSIQGTVDELADSVIFQDDEDFAIEN